MASGCSWSRSGLVIPVALSAPTPIQLLVIAVLMLVGIVLVEFLGRRASPVRPI